MQLMNIEILDVFYFMKNISACQKIYSLDTFPYMYKELFISKTIQLIMNYHLIFIIFYVCHDRYNRVELFRSSFYYHTQAFWASCVKLGRWKLLDVLYVRFAVLLHIVLLFLAEYYIKSTCISYLKYKRWTVF